MEPLRIVAIGGGTGLSTLLHGLKRYAQHPQEAEITAVVTVSDDGGSSGRLRRDFEVLPPGDIQTAWWRFPRTKACYRNSSNTGFRGAKDSRGTASETCS